MSQLLVRQIPPEWVDALRRRAKQHGRSAEAEHRAILGEVLRPVASDFWELAKQLREATAGRVHTDSADLIREMRDER